MHLTLVGRRNLANLHERDGRWFIAQLRPVGQYQTNLTLLQGKLDMVDATVTAALHSPAQRQQFKEYLDAHGDYVDLWHRYANIEWSKATEAGRKLGVLRYTTREAFGEEKLRWRFEVDPESAHAFLKRWEVLIRDSKLPEFMIEAGAELPEWMQDEEQVKAAASNRPVIGGQPLLNGSWLSLSYDPNQSQDAPPEFGVLFLSIHGQRKVHERREQALKKILERRNPMPQLHVLLEGQPVPTRRDWRKEKPLSRKAREAFQGNPTDMQKRALDIALNTPDIAVIIGPPGTGKTQVISALQQRLAESYPDPESVQYQLLITSYQHDAVDNALSRINVFGLPGLRIGGRRRDATANTDRLSGWREMRLAELEPKLDAAIAAEPMFATLKDLRNKMTRLRIQPLRPSERAKQAVDIDKQLQHLADVYGLRPTVTTEKSWQNWLRKQKTEQGQSTTDQRMRRLLRRGIWSLRVTADSFADDGCCQCFRLLDLTHRLGYSLGDTERILLEELATLSEPSENQLATLKHLRNSLLTATRFDSRPPSIKNALNSEGCQLLDDLLSELDKHLKRRPEWARLFILGEYLEDIRLDPQKLERAVQAYTTVLGATCQQAASKPMQELFELDDTLSISFDTVVIDEAARATPLDLLIPMAMARRRIILVGDHLQLPHLLDPDTEDALEQSGDLTEAEHNALRESLFERLVQGLRTLALENFDQPRRVVTLDSQFRMHPVLGDFVSRTFYEAVGEPAIQSGRPPEDFHHQVPGLEGRVCAWIDLPVRKDNQDRRQSSGSRIRAIEAAYAAREAKRILEACPELSLGVITFYAAQRDLILRAMGEQGLSEQQDGRWNLLPKWARNESGTERLRVGTVDAFQGKEFDIVLLSIVRTNMPLKGRDRECALTAKYGFLRVTNRMNVAMSRQRRLLIVIGDLALARAPETSEAAPSLAAFLHLCESEYGHVL